MKNLIYILFLTENAQVSQPDFIKETTRFVCKQFETDNNSKIVEIASDL